MSRNYGAERARRAQLAQERGLSQRYARGHSQTPERPERLAQLTPDRKPRDLAPFERYLTTGPQSKARLQRLEATEGGRTNLADWNLRRNLEGKHDIASTDPGPGAAGRWRRQIMPGFSQADEWARPIPIGYVVMYPLAAGSSVWGLRIDKGKAA